MKAPSGGVEGIEAGRPSEALLRALSDAIATIGPMRGGVAFVPTCELARHVPAGVALTVDFTASRRIGAPLVVLRAAARPPLDDPLAALTPRERDVARLVGEGRSNKSVARLLGVTLGTVKDHVHHILRKSGHPNRASFAAAMGRCAAAGVAGDASEPAGGGPSIFG